MKIKFTILILVMCAVTQAEVYQYKTYYYELTATIENGVRTSQSGDGQFYTFTPQSCYESDKNGYSEGLGTASYKNYANSIYVYRGSGFYGEADYCVTDNYETLNIKTTGGKIYVLHCKTAPSDFIASKHKEIDEQLRAMITIGQYPLPLESPVTAGSSTPSHSSAPTTEYYTCPSCYGSGKCPVCHGKKIINNPYTGNDMICTSCTGGVCSACGGTGKKVRIKR